MIKKFNIILVLSLLLLVSISAASAADDTNTTLADDQDIVDVYSSGEEVILQESTHTIDSKNYNSYFNYKSGELVSSEVNEGDTIYLNGTFAGSKDSLNFVFDKRVNVVGTDSNSMKNSVLTFKSGASGSTISNLKISNTNDYSYGIFLNGASNCVITDCFIKNTGQSSYAICVANGANYNNVTNNVVQTYGVTYGHGTRSTPTIVLSGAHYNYIAGNKVNCDDANAIYLSSYDGGPLKGGNSNFNVIYNNTITYFEGSNQYPTSWSWGIQTMGTNNTIDSNTIIGSYRAISTMNYGNIIVNNMIINLTGADYNNPTVELGGEYAIVGAANALVKNNTIINAKVISTGAAISVTDNSIVEDNNIEVTYLGRGILPVGSNILIKNNNITTQSGSVIFWEGDSRNLTVTGNNITSQSGVGVLIKKASDKKMPKNLTITNNYISTNNAYAIDAKDADKSTVNVIESNSIPSGSKSLIATPEGEYDPSKPRYVFDEENPIIITPSNYDDYIDVNGKLSSSIKSGDVLYFKGEFANKIVIYVNSAVKITGDNPIFYNTTFRLSSPGVWIDGITIKNINSSKENAWGVLVYGISGAKISNCDIEVVDPNAAYAIYVVESSNVDVLNNNLASSGNYLTYTLLAISAEECNFINNTIYTLGTGNVHQFENEHCIDGNQSCVDGSTVCADGDENCVDGSTVCADGDENCVDGSTVCTDGSTVCTDGNENCVDGDEVCTSGNTIPGNHVLQEVYRTYGILMAYCSECNVSGNKVNVTSKLNKVLPFYNSTNSIVGIDLYYNTHNNVVSNNDIYVKANDNYIYGMGVLGYYTGHNAPEGQGASNNQFINNNIVLEGTYFVQGIVVGDESVDTVVTGNTVNAKSNNYSYGVNLEMSQKSIIKQNNFTLNSDIAYGIQAFSSNDNVINDNNLDIQAKQAYGMVLSNSANNELSDNNIANNVTGEEISYKITDSVGAGVAGIYLKSNSSDNSIKDNNITSSKGYSIIISDEAINNIISNNFLASEKGNANNAINSTQNNNVNDNYNQLLSIDAGDFEFNYLDLATFSVNVSVDGANVEFFIAGEEIGNATVSNGIASLTYKLDDSFIPSNYVITAIASKDGFSTKETSSTLSINKGNLNVNVKDVSGIASSVANFTAVITDANGNVLSDVEVRFYYYNGRNVLIGKQKTGDDGVAKLSSEIPPVDVGNYQLIASIADSDNFNSANASATLEITKLKPSITGNKNYAVYYGNTVTYKIRILAGDGNTVKDGEIVAIKIGSSTYNVKTSNGYATKSVKLKTGSYTVTATYDGVKVTNKITVKATIVAKNISKKKAKTIKFTAKLLNKNGKILKNKKITFKIKNKKYTAKTNKKGIATLSIKNLKVGKYTITSSYGGCTISNKITIKK